MFTKMKNLFCSLVAFAFFRNYCNSAKQEEEGIGVYDFHLCLLLLQF